MRPMPSSRFCATGKNARKNHGGAGLLRRRPTLRKWPPRRARTARSAATAASIPRPKEHPSRFRGSIKMASAAKIAANRRNAQKSTGPRSAAGKARARYNALEHGLTIPISQDARVADQITTLASELCEESTAPLAHDLALRAAEAELELVRVRRARVCLINSTAERLEARSLLERAALA